MGADGHAWRLKRIHRLIVLSNTYAQSSDFREPAAKLDPENGLVWRFPYHRLDAEALRDAVLAVSGQLNPRMAGAGVYPRIAQAVLEGQSRPGSGWGKFDEHSAARRSAYIFVKRSLLVPELELLDFADTTAACEQRTISTIPTQALTLLNGEFFNDQARHFAARVAREAGDNDAQRVARAYRLALARLPAADEQAQALDFLDSQIRQIADEDAQVEGQPRDARQTALQALCLVLFNLNEFSYLD